MSHQHLQNLREILHDLLVKAFIRPSSSEVSSPILFVAKPDGRIRMCCDYTQLNKVIKKDRYPLPLITDTLREVGKANYITKLDITAAFHRLRIREGDEWNTAFITRYGLFEWLVIPFGLSPSPASFQRYINHTLHDLLDRGVSVYVDQRCSQFNYINQVNQSTKQLRASRRLNQSSSKRRKVDSLID